ncbi:MAG: hypothetical protein R2711_18365 [Acidimicrobiales bacterium]
MRPDPRLSLRSGHRLQQQDVEAFIEASRIAPGTLEHLYPEVVGSGDKGGDED